LAMVLGIVQAHHGWIMVHSAPGQGSTFEVFLPAAEEEARSSHPGEAAQNEGVRGWQGEGVTDGQDRITPSPPHPLTPSSAGPPAPAVAEEVRKPTVLVVDDEETLRRLVCLLLARAGFRTLSAAGGDEALAIYRKKGDQIDVVLLDYQMPRRSGLEVMRDLQALNPDVRVVFASGYVASDQERLLSAGARGVVGKPFHSDDLTQALHLALSDQPAAC